MEKDKPEADVEEELAENIIKITKDEKQKTKWDDLLICKLTM